MPTDLKAYRIFIASPGGLQDERKAFRREVQSYNESEAVPRGVTFIPVGWEETLGGVGRPQSIINEDVRKCDYFLLLLCDRWGSPSSKDGSGYTSGTEEEYSVAMECYEDPELFMRQIVMMFKGVDPKQLSDPGPQFQKVLDFKRDVEREKKHLFRTFDTVESFCELLRRHLGRWLRDHEEGAAERVEEPAPLPSRETSEAARVEALLEPAAPMTEDSLISGAWSLADEGRLTEAEVEFSKAIVVGNDPEAFLQYGRFLVRGGRLDQAMIMFERGRVISEAQGEEAVMARVCANLGNVLRTRGDLDGAEEMHRKALEIAEKLGSLEGMAAQYGNLGNVLMTRGYLGGAEEMYRKSLEISEKLGSLEGTASAYGNLGVVLQTRGDLDEAEEMYRKSLEIEEKLGRLEGIADAYGNLGIVLRIRGDLDGAEDMHRKALEIEEKLGRLEGIASDYGNLGNVLKTRGDLDGAEEMHRKSLEIEEKLGRLEGIAAEYGNLGVVLQARGDLDGAEEVYHKALGINVKLGRFVGIAIQYGNLGNVLRTRGDLGGAEEMYRKALEIEQKLGVPDRVAQAQGLLDSLRASE